jgi:DNA-binding response OmpR family regulator
VTWYLERDGFKVIPAADGKDALEKVQSESPHLIILDIMLPHVDGWEVCRQVRRESATPILMLTAKDAEVEKVLGLELGADDYLTKPFSPRELVARVKAILRRSQGGMTPSAETVREFGALVIDLQRRRVTKNGQDISLTKLEFELLRLLSSQPGRVFPREDIVRNVWGENYVGDFRVADVHIHHLRDKIESDPAQPQFIYTIWGVGYKFDPADKKKKSA